MASQDQQPQTGENPAETWSRIAKRSQRVMQQMMARPAGAASPEDMAPIVEAFTAMTQRLLSDPAQLAQVFNELRQVAHSGVQGPAVRYIGLAD